jgi:hypothetical protein
MVDIKDTIPRLHQILPHMCEQLVGLKTGTTFEQARQRYSFTVNNLALKGVGRRTASRVGDRDAYWAPTAEVLMEAMRLGFVERCQVPSARRYVEAHRDREYSLTSLGRDMADLAENNIAAFCDRLAAALYENHSYFRALIGKLQDAPIACPEVSESEVDAASRDKQGTQHWTEYVADKLSQQGSTSADVDTKSIRQLLVSMMRRRFGAGVEEKPSTKSLTQALNDAFAVAALRARGLLIGATEIDVLKAWGSQLRVLDQSRYIPGHEGFNVIWLAAEIDESGPTSIRRRDLGRYEIEIANAIIAAYRNQAEMADTKLSAPYLPIYKVRAEAAFRCRVTRALVDIVLERLSEGAVAGIAVRLRLHLGTTHQPVSEPLYRRGGNRRYELTINDK